MKFTQTVFCMGVALALLGVGCASPIKPQIIMPAAKPQAKAYPGSVEVVVDGSIKSPNITVIDIPTFQTAICETIQRDKIFIGGVVTSNGDYQLRVTFLSVEWPGAGAGMTTSFTSRWKLSHTADGNLVWDDIIRGSHTTPFGEAFAGMTRAMRSIEGAARTTIADGLKGVQERAP